MSSDHGMLQVNVYAQNVGVPVENAKVTVTDRDSLRIIDEFLTDSSGQTAALELEAPPVEYSLGYGNNKPYSEYNVFVEAENLETTAFYGVQIFPGTEAVTNASMQYIDGNEQSRRNIIIPEPVLWGAYPAKIPESDVKELPPAYGYVVLPDVVIPEYIIVHLGSPSSNAQNVWIPYKDYIKNVASSEIYSTWPEETIKANILAINSFTLNRVYTEWYRGKGYDFTITNTTAYDQAFSYGRNIFREISNAVDDLFSTYITKPGIEQPLLTQYCDGRKTLCEKGLKQWGSKELGDQGYSATEILKYYYGYDIYYDSAPKVDGVPVSFGGEVLSFGSSGDAVRTIQQQLNIIAGTYSSIPLLPVTGFYGEQTQNSVTIFQRIFGMPQSGRVDFATWYQISNIYVSIKKLSELSV